MVPKLPPLIVSRQPRQIGKDWSHASSWFGGKPRLGSLSWPRGGPQQKPMHFIAQIDLGAVAHQLPEGAIPEAGSLAFFLGAQGSTDGAVIFVPPSSSIRETDPPADAPAIFEPGADIFPQNADAAAPRLFRYWPIDIAPIDLDQSCEATNGEMQNAVSGMFTRRQ